MGRAEQHERRISGAVLDNAPGVLYMYDRTGKFLRWNKNFELASGYSAAEIATMHPLDFFTGADKDLVAARIDEVFAKGESTVEAEMRSKDGRLTPYFFTGTLTPINGQPCLIGVGIDVTRHKQADAARHASDARYRALFEYAPDGIVIADLESFYIDANASICRMLGYTRDELIGLHASDIVVKSEITHIAVALAAIKKQTSYHREWQMKRKDGSIFPAEVMATMMPDGNVMGIIRDVAVRRQAEEALRDKARQLHAADHRLAEILQGMTDACFSLDTEWRFTFLNDRCVSLFRQPREAVLQRTLWDVFPDLLNTPTETHYRHTMAKRTPVAFEARSPIEELWLDIRLFPTGQGLAAFLLDITTRKKLEAQFLQAQKMDAFGQLAGGVSHDFNNLLTVINGYSSLLLERLPQDDPNRAFVEQISKAGERSTALTRQLLAFSRKQVIAPRYIDLTAVIADMDKMLRRIIGEDIQLTTTPGAEPGTIHADPSLIEQMIMNLAVNARDAMTTGGRLTIETSNVDLDEIYVGLQMAVQPGSYVVLTISDTGTGMTEEVRKRIFEPFFTTKEPGKGTGLGLAVVHGVVQQTGGHILVYSESGIGTTFRIYLPRSRSFEPQEKPPAHNAVARGGSETILLVEDDAGVRALTCAILKDLGYNVLEAPGGLDGVRVAKEHLSPIHLLVTDVVMPEMGGRQVAELLLQRQPDLKVLYVSGYTDDSIVRYGILQDQVHFLQKPYTAGALTLKVRSVLDA